MRIIADENFPDEVVAALRTRGHDVFAVAEIMPAAEDGSVLARAQSEDRLVVTFDKGFGELAFRFGLPATCGVILFRLAGVSPESDNSRAMQAIESREDWRGCFATVTNDRIRIRPLPFAPRIADQS